MRAQRLAEGVQGTMKPNHVSVWLRDSETVRDDQ